MLLEKCTGIQKSEFLCWNPTITTVIHYVGVIPGFPKSPRCILQLVLLTGLTHIFAHTLKDVWHQPIHAPEEEQTTAQWQVARTTTDNVQLSWSTFFCDVWHIRWAYRLQQVWELEAEGRFRAHCNTMYEDISEKILNIESCCLQSCRKKKTILYLKIVVLHIFAHCAAFAAAPTFKADFFFVLFSLFYICSLKNPIWFPFCLVLHIRWFKQRMGWWWSKSLTFTQASPWAFWNNLVSGHIAKTFRMSCALGWTFRWWNFPELHQQRSEFVASPGDKRNDWAAEQQQVQVLESGQQRETHL